MDMRSRWLGTAPPVLPQPYNRLIHLPWLVNDTCHGVCARSMYALNVLRAHESRHFCSRFFSHSSSQSLRRSGVDCGVLDRDLSSARRQSSRRVTGVIHSSSCSCSICCGGLRQLPRIYLLTLQVKDWFANTVRKRRKKENNPLSRLSYAAHPDSGTVVPLARDSGTVLDRVPAVFIWYMSIIRRTC